MQNQSPPWRHVWITGASSGLGEHVARLLAERGCIVSITARREERLQAVSSAHPNIFPYPADATDPNALKQVATQIQAGHGDVDLALFCTGAWFPGSVDDLQVDNFVRTLDVNIMSIVNGLDAVLPTMLERGTGHVAWVASVAGYVGLPKSASYGASKAALNHMAQSMQNEMLRKGIAVSVINPGFVETELTASNKRPMPFLMQPEAAAEKMVRGLQRKQFEIAFPWQIVTLLKFLRMLPNGLQRRMIKWIFL